MQIKLKGSALTAVVGMVLAVGVAAPASAAPLTKPTVETYIGNDATLVAYTIPAVDPADPTQVIKSINYRLFTSGGSGTGNGTVTDAPAQSGANSFFIDAAAIGDNTRVEVGYVTEGATSDSADDVYTWSAGGNNRVGTTTTDLGTIATTGTTPDAAVPSITVNGVVASSGTLNFIYTTDDGVSWAAAAAVGTDLTLMSDSTGAAIDANSSYSIWLRAVTSGGGGASYVSAATYVGVAGFAPSAPAITLASVGATSATVNLATPSMDMGLGVTGYEYSTNGGTDWSDAGLPDGSGNITIGGLANKVSTSIWLRGVNAIGTSAYSNELTNVIPVRACSAVADGRLRFSAGKAKLTNAGKAELNQFAAEFAESNCTGVNLVAYRVVVKSAKTNKARLALSYRRLAVVKAYLAAAGVTGIDTRVMAGTDNRLVVGSPVGAPL